MTVFHRNAAINLISDKIQQQAVSARQSARGFMLSNGFEPLLFLLCALWRKGRFGLRLSTGLLPRTEW
jgi:hypothetical protein